MARFIPLLAATALLASTPLATAADDAYLWSPLKDAAGRIRAESVSALELNTWYEVKDTSLVALKRKIEKALGRPYNALNYGVEDLNSTFNAWVGGDLGDDGRFYIPWGGGHGASSLNGIWALDIEKMGGDDTWQIVQPPSDPEKPGAEWSAQYKKSKNFTNYRPALAFPADILPDGKPTARHQYSGVWFDSKRKTINQSRGHLWTFNTLTGETVGDVWHVDGKDRYPGIYGNLWYNEFHDTVVGHLRFKEYGYFDHIRYDPDTHTVELHGGLPWNFGGSTCGTRYRDSILYLGYDGEKRSARWAVYDLKAQRMHGGKFDGVAFNWENEMPACVYIPEWDKVLRRMQHKALRGQWFTFDPNTHTEAHYQPSGRIPPFDRHPGKKVFYYAPWKSVIYITTPKVEHNTVYVMRVG